MSFGPDLFKRKPAPKLADVFSSPVAPEPIEPPPTPIALEELPQPTTSGRQASVWLFAVLGVAMLGVFGYVVLVRGPGAAAIGALFALIPLVIVGYVVYRIDRWEPEPRSLLLFALAWGAIGAIGIALVVGTGLGELIPNDVGTQFVTNVVQVPIVEETAKALGLVILLIVGKRAFDGPVDGIVYGMLIGAGFAFTENILYFAGEWASGNPLSFGLTFVLRSVLSPFSHAMYTGLVGFAIGRMLQAETRGPKTNLYALLGLLGGVLLHAIWNGAAFFITDTGGWTAFYTSFQIPLFWVCAYVVSSMRRAEREVTEKHLREYQKHGWFTAREVEIVSNPKTRAQTLQWAKKLHPPERRIAVKEFISSATQLAITRQRAVSGRDDEATAEQQLLLERTVQARREMAVPI